MRRAAPLLAVVLGGCWLEKVTGEPVPLDPRFYEAVEATQGDPGVGGGDAIPFSDHDGAKVVIRGTATSPIEGPIEIDVRTPDPTAEGGVKGHGKVQLDGLGPFELEVPSGLGALELQAFQDPDADGPGGDDPFAQVSLEIGTEDLSDILFELVPGARGTSGGPTHTEAPPGAPGGNPGGGPAHQEVPPGSGAGPEGPPMVGPDGQPPVGPDGQPMAGPDGQPPPGEGAPAPGGMPPFVGLTGGAVTLSGTLNWPDAPAGALIDLDLFRPSDTAGGGREMLGKLKVPVGAFSFEAPEDFGLLVIEAFIDIDGNGPGQGDPMGSYAGNPISIGTSDINGITIDLTVTESGYMPGNEPPPNDDLGGL